MEGKLIKVENGYVLMVNDIMYAKSDDKLPIIDCQKLSLKNCQAIENGYDLDELAKYFGYKDFAKFAFIEGFQKALEILGDKKFSVDGFIDFYIEKTGYGMDMWSKEENNIMSIVADYIQSLQQTEWEVEIEMVNTPSQVFYTNDVPYVSPKIDKDGCLILKRKS